MSMTTPFSAALGEQWLLERTYHAQLRNGGELSVPKLTHAMKQIISFYHEATLPSGVYRLAFFGPRMDEPGYKVQSGRTRQG